MKHDTAILPPREPIAVVGVSALFPGTPGTGGFWRDILAGRDSITDVPPSHWLIEDFYDPDPRTPDRTYARRGGFLNPVPFEPMEFGIPPVALTATDTAQLLALVVAKQVLREATATEYREIDPSRVSVVLGVASTTELVGQMAARQQRPIWVKALREEGLPEDQVQLICDRIADHFPAWQESTFPGLLGNVVAGRIANRLDLGGTNCVIDAACASSLAAVKLAINELHLGQSDMVITGGVDALNDILMFMCFSKTPAFSRSGVCRPFSAAADGTVIGEGVGMLALRRLTDAERDGNRIYAVIRGLGSSSDGRSTSVYAPRPEGQAAALRRAYAEAGYSPRTVELVEAHGTGTIAGDAAELAGLRGVFEDGAGEDGQWCALGSVKSQIGHAKAAAGAAGLIKTVLALHHKVLPPTIGIDQPNPKVDLERSPFYLSTTTRPWIHQAASPRRASVSSFGFGGSNFHVTLEEYTGSGRRPARIRAFPVELVLFSADTRTELIDKLSHLHDRVAEGRGLTEIAARSAAAFSGAAPVRLALVIENTDELLRIADDVARRLGGPEDLSPSLPSRSFFAEGPGAPGKVAFLFPGQGSQYCGMGADLAMSFERVREVWDELAGQRTMEGMALHEIVFPRPSLSDEARREAEARLTRMANAQPAIGAASLALLRLLESLEIRPDLLAGHSFGEIVALHASGVFDRPTAIGVASVRGRVMTEASMAAGAMIAVPLTRATVEARLDVWGLDLVVANDNAPDQVVLSGPVAAVSAAVERLRDERVAAVRLPVASAFHSPIVAAAEQPFLEHLREVDLAAPQVPVYANTTAEPYPPDSGSARSLLAGQIARGVRFRETIDRLYAEGARTFIEVGPGSVLTRLVGRCLADRPHLAVALDSKGVHGVRALLTGLARLATAGVAINPAELFADVAPEADPAPQPSAHAVHILGTNYGKRYPPAGGADALPRPNISAPTRAPEIMSPSPSNHAPPAGRPEQPSAPATTSRGDASALELHRQLAETHLEFQRMMNEAHTTYLRVVERALAGEAGNAPAEPSFPAVPFVPPPPPEHAIEMPPAPPEPGLPARVAYEPPAGPAVRPTAPEPAPAPPAEPAELAAQPPSTPTAASVDVRQVLLEVVSEKTGYPVEMLSLEMEMEGELGIDSIKRVEILSAMVDRLPEMPEVDPSELGRLRTLADVLEFAGRANAPAPARDLVELAAAAPPVTDASPADAPTALIPRLVPAPASGLGMPGLLAADGIAIVPEPGGVVAEALLERLRARGLSARVVEDPRDSEAVIFLGGLAPVASADAGMRVQLAALSWARAVARRLSEAGGVFVTVQDTGGGFCLAGVPDMAPWAGGLPGLVRTARIEWPRAVVKAIDIAIPGAAPAAVADALIEELLNGGPEVEVALCESGRFSLLYEPTTGPIASPAVPVLERGAVVVASGGARGITPGALLSLAGDHPLKFILLGRTVLSDDPDPHPGIDDPVDLRAALARDARERGDTRDLPEIGRSAEAILAQREIRSTLRRLEETGSEALYLTVDVRDRDAVAAALNGARGKLGPISAIVHAAGVIRDRALGDKRTEEAETVLGVKLLGLESLLGATEADPLKLICLFSSVAATTGNAGQGDYAMANETLHRLAHFEAARRPGCAIRSIGWGPWAGGMVRAELASHFAARGISLIDLDAGARFFRGACVDGGFPEVVAAHGAFVGAMTWRSELVIGPGSHPYLLDHAINGQPVLPMVLVLEWFLRVTRSIRGGPVSLRDLRVLRGIVLGDLETSGDRFVIEASGPWGARQGPLQLRLLDREGAVRYAASADVRLTDFETEPDPPEPPADSRGWPWSARQASADLLFHGPAFHALRSLDRIWETGAEGDLEGVESLGWPPEPWAGDPAALDGALQLVLLWAIERTGLTFLPARVEVCRLLAPLAGRDRLRCRASIQLDGQDRAISDLYLLDADGRTLGWLKGVEWYRMPLADSLAGRTKAVSRGL